MFEHAQEGHLGTVRASATLDEIPREIYGTSRIDAGDVHFKFQFEGGLDILAHLVQTCGLDSSVAGPLDFDLCVELETMLTDFFQDVITRARQGKYRLSPEWLYATEGDWIDEEADQETPSAPQRKSNGRKRAVVRKKG
jgi:hypothetical protein